MARKALIVKQQKLARLREKYVELKQQYIAEGKEPPKVKWFKPTKYYNRCQITGRSKSYIREFWIDRVTFRKYARKWLIMGVKKASR